MNALLLTFLLLGAAPDSQTVQSYMQCGGEAMEQQDWETSTRCHRLALGSDMLNDVGAAVAYWNIFVSEDHLGHVDKSMYAVLGFIVYGSLSLDNPRYNEATKGFAVKRKLGYAIAALQATWASRNDYSCRSLLFACHTTAEEFIRVFEQKIPFCGKEDNIVEVKVNREKNLVELEVSCSNGPERYYFVTTNEF